MRVQALAGTTRLSKKRPLASLTLPGCALRLLVEAVDIALDGDGSPVGNGAKAQPPGFMAAMPVLRTSPTRTG